MGNLLQDRLQRYEEAEAAYRQAIALDEKYAWPWNGLGNLLQNHLQRYEEAEAAYRNAIARDTKFERPWVGLANLLHDKLQRDDDAIFALEQASAISPNSPWPLGNLARIQAARGEHESAAAHYRQTLALCSDDDKHLSLQAHLYLANQDLARQALQALAAQAEQGDNLAMFRLREQVQECWKIGLGAALAALMESSDQAGFLQPLSAALRAAGGDNAALAALPAELRGLAEELAASLRTA